ncbi:hypothetical protein [Micromonospora sp. WMMD1155]|uniref:hypothetical protein n=1 Tax=Micromonospora sp. WMMD1155 TaxID=3016094 RepID=UPI00249B9BA2|nr:hypothetical protein [Micromonospora sp. WMMD1155]WFE53241.1 hypothetical protein O7617_24285 [Micromonospora sp. WMMD1155]
MADPVARFRVGYGSSLRHLVVMIACFALAGWVVLRLAGEPSAGRMLLWFVGAAIAHDLVLFPIYASADRALKSAVGRRRRAGVAGSRLRASAAGDGSAPPSPLNHVRVPALAAGLLFLVYLPGILRQGRATYLDATGQDQQPYLCRWLVITGALFLLSGISYAARRIQWRRRVGLAR